MHWALFSSSEIALSYLLSWKPNLTIKNNDGNTITHLAITTIEEVMAIRPLRFVLVRGAPVNEKNNEGHKPIDLI